MMSRHFVPISVVVLILLTTTTSLAHSSKSHRAGHHKVHNLALYPDRHSWCLSTPIRQEIASKSPECSPTTIDNVVCLGACFSYSVPRAEDDAVIEPYCDACRATVVEWRVITLNCTHPTTGESYYLPKNVELISNCSCVDCNGNTPRGGSTNNEDDDEEDSEEDERARRLQTNHNQLKCDKCEGGCCGGGGCGD